MVHLRCMLDLPGEGLPTGNEAALQQHQDNESNVQQHQHQQQQQHHPQDSVAAQLEAAAQRVVSMSSMAVVRGFRVDQVGQTAVAIVSCLVLLDYNLTASTSALRGEEQLAPLRGAFSTLVEVSNAANHVKARCSEAFLRHTAAAASCCLLGLVWLMVGDGTALLHAHGAVSAQSVDDWLNTLGLGQLTLAFHAANYTDVLMIQGV
jgi:hypothetical protein